MRFPVTTTCIPILSRYSNGLEIFSLISRLGKRRTNDLKQSIPIAAALEPGSQREDTISTKAASSNNVLSVVIKRERNFGRTGVGDEADMLKIKWDVMGLSVSGYESSPQLKEKLTSEGRMWKAAMRDRSEIETRRRDNVVKMHVDRDMNALKASGGQTRRG